MRYTEVLHMLSIRIVFLILGLVALLLAALEVRAPHVNLQALGLTFWLLAIIVG
jgi:hypothetical protein